MQETGIADVGFGGFDLTFLGVGEVGGEEADHEGLSEDVEIAADGGVGHSEGAAQLGTVQELSVVVGEHGPKAAEEAAWELDAEFAEVAFEVGFDEVRAPQDFVFVRLRSDDGGL